MNKIIITNELPTPENKVGPNEWGCGLKEHGSLLEIKLKWIDKSREVPNGIGSNVNSRITYNSGKIRTKRGSCTELKPELLGPIVRGEKPDIFIALDNQVLENKLFSAKPEKKNLTDFTAVTAANKFSVGFRCIDEATYKFLENYQVPKGANITFMPCLLTFTTKYPNDLKVLDEARINNPNIDYFQEINKTPLSHIEAMLSSMQASINAYVKKARENGINEVIIRPFINQGELAGASQKRLHTQTYLDLTPGHTSSYEALLKSSDTKSECSFCKSAHDNRIVYNNGEFTCWEINAAIRNYHLRLAPNKHVERFTDLSKQQIHGLADALKKVNAALSVIGVTSHRNTLMQTLYEGYSSRFHFHIDLIPYSPIGGAELFGDVSVVTVDPISIASELRNAMKDLEIKDYTY